MKKSLDDWLDTLTGLHTQRIDLGLERITAIADELELRAFSVPVITVGGTNGKGSTVRILESIYTRVGYRVGAYTSPHLMRFNERVRIQEKNVTDAALIEAFEVIEKQRGDRPLSFFEYTTLAALYLFQEARLDVILLEVGLGGRLDATNIVDSDCSVVTSIDIDHTEWLGDTREAIAFEKAGIFRAGCPAVCGDKNPPDTLINHAKAIGAKLVLREADFFAEESARTWCFLGAGIRYENLPYPPLKLDNAASALAVISVVQDQLPVDAGLIAEALSTVRLPGRFESRLHPVPCIFDVAHNRQSAVWLVEQLKETPVNGPTIAVFGVLEDKVLADMIDILKGEIDSWYVAELEHFRAASMDKMAGALRDQSIKNWYTAATIGAAMQDAVKACEEDPSARVLVFGSFYAVAEAKGYLEELE